MAQRYTVRLNSIDKIEQLLQEIYNQSCQELNEVQNEINKLGNSTDLTDATIEEKTKYAKAMNDFVNTKLKTIQLKKDVATFMSELIKHNSNLSDTLNDPLVGKKVTYDITAWKNIANESKDEKKSETEVYDLN